MPELQVQASEAAQALPAARRKLREAMFEVITSEASYLKSLNILVNNFVRAPELSSSEAACVLGRQQKHHLFSNILAVCAVSERFLARLEAVFREDIFMEGLCQVMREQAAGEFDVYIKYCSNQVYQEKQLDDLRKNNPAFMEVLARLEARPECQGLSMHSFLLLPMQRITRLPLLVDAICSRLPPDSPLSSVAQEAWTVLNKIVQECNEGARTMEKMEQMIKVTRQLEFRVKHIALASSSRSLVKQGELTRIVPDNASLLPFGRGRPTRQSVYLLLFNDLLLVAKRKSDDQFAVWDYCWRQFLQVTPVENPGQHPKLRAGVPPGCRHCFLLILLENHEGKSLELILSTPSETTCLRWIEAIQPPETEVDGGEKLYADWDCPQVCVTHEYLSSQPDEISLLEGEIINVRRKMPDGWYEGEKLNGGAVGWFPSTHTKEIANAHVRAKNLRQRYRLLAATEEFVVSQGQKRPS